MAVRLSSTIAIKEGTDVSDFFKKKGLDSCTALGARYCLLYTISGTDRDSIVSYFPLFMGITDKVGSSCSANLLPYLESDT